MRVTGGVFRYDEAIFWNKNFSIPLSKIKYNYDKVGLKMPHIESIVKTQK